MITITETDWFLKRASKLLSVEEKDDLISYVAENPEAGSIIPKTGGVRKLRYAREGQGKSGSFRVIYYYFDPGHPIFMFDIFGKNEKENLSDADKQNLYKGIQILKKELRS